MPIAWHHPAANKNWSRRLQQLEEKLSEVREIATSPCDKPARAESRMVFEKYSRLEWLVPVVLCVMMFAQLIATGVRLSQTSDEGTHLYSAYRYLKCGDLTISAEHPPLAKIVAAAPLLLMNFTVNCAPVKGDDVQQAFACVAWLYSQNWPVALVRARMAVSSFAVGLVLLVWIAARRMFGLSTAVVATMLVVFEPNILAYGSLVMTDVPVTCMLLFAILAFYFWVQRRTAGFLLLAALATGLTLLSKNSGVAVLLILPVLAIADAFAQPASTRAKWRFAFHNLLAVALICILAMGVVWAGYGMRFAAYPGAQQARVPQPSTATSASQWASLELEQLHLLPQAYLQGFRSAVTLSNQGAVSFVAGKTYLKAPWFSTPFNFLIRNTVAALLLMLLSVFGLVYSFRQHRRECLFLLIPAAVFLAVCLHARTNVNVRYLLPIFPFLLIATAAGCVELAKRVPWVRYAILCLILLHAASSLRAYPNYISYANELWGGPANAYKYLPSMDGGQAYPQAKDYLTQHPAAHPAEDCWLITGWQWDPAFYGVPCQTFGLYVPHEIPPHLHGTVIVSSSLITDVRLAEGEISAPFRNATPVARIGGSALLVYQGDFDTSLDASTGERNLATYAFSLGHVSDALEHSQKAVMLAPSSVLAHANLCRLMAPSDMESALKECFIARQLLLRDPLQHEPTRQHYMDLFDSLLNAQQK